MVTGYADVVADDKAPGGSDGAGEEDVEGEPAGVLLALPGSGAHRGQNCHRACLRAPGTVRSGGRSSDLVAFSSIFYIYSVVADIAAAVPHRAGRRAPELSEGRDKLAVTLTRQLVKPRIWL